MLETAIVLLLAMVFCTAVCTLYSWILTPDSGDNTWTVVRSVGPGEGLEQRVRSLMWLRACGLLRGRVVVLDNGLDADGRQLALRLARRWPELEIWSEVES